MKYQGAERGPRLNYDDCRSGFFSGAPLPGYCDEYFRYFQPGPVTEREDQIVFRRDQTPPEETEEYQHAMRIYEDHLRLRDEALTVFDSLYWFRRMKDLVDFWTTWSPWAKDKLVLFGQELIACMFAGVVFISFWGILLNYFGSMRLKTAGTVLLIFISATTFATNSIEIAATSVIGISIIGVLFLSKISTGNHLEFQKVSKNLKHQKETNGLGNAEQEIANEYDVVIRVHYWYVGQHSLWINMSTGWIGID